MASAEKADRDRIERLIVQPAPAAKQSPSVTTEQSLGHDARILLKKGAIEYYGLGVTMTGTDSSAWKCHTMLGENEPVEGIPFSACDLAHIWPVEMSRQADEIAADLKLPDGFFTEPRNFLVLPRIVHVAFDSEAVLLVPKRDGTVVVRQWRADKLSAKDAENLAPYYNQTLRWSNLAEAPCVPFMRLLVWRMMMASRAFPAATRSASDTHSDALEWREEALLASATVEANAALKSLIGRYNLISPRIPTAAPE